MRTWSLLVFLVACTHHHASDLPGRPVPLTCDTSVADYCAANGCNRTLAAAEQDKSLCPATLGRCGKYQVVSKGSIDVVTRWYYQAGQLVAVANLVVPSRYTCLAGPATFDVPRCAAPAQTLPACGP